MLQCDRYLPEVLGIVASAYFLVYLKDVYRRDFIAYQRMVRHAERLHVDYGKLLLEESTWASASRIQRLAQKKLKIYIPGADELKVIVLPKKEE